MKTRRDGKGWIKVDFNERDRFFFIGHDTLYITQRLFRHLAKKVAKLTKGGEKR